jgi:phosphoglycolate phosphatase-like HAD superfamily hydrolase
MGVLAVIETIRPGSAKDAQVVLFDFDGTLSLIRSGWMDVMVPMMVEILARLKTGESEAELTLAVREFVYRLTGRETVYQMIELADQVRQRRGVPLDPLEYKRMYLDRLWEVIRDRVEALRSRAVSPDTYLVPGSRDLLEELEGRGLTMYLASGTDHESVLEEARLLEIDRYFRGGVFGAQDDLTRFSKQLLVQRIMSTAGFSGSALLAFGDGYVEIEEVKKAGGVSVGVATAEPECMRIDDWKRLRLIRAGADYIIPNYLCRAELSEVLFDGRPIQVSGV